MRFRFAVHQFRTEVREDEIEVEAPTEAEAVAKARSHVVADDRPTVDVDHSLYRVGADGEVEDEDTPISEW